jgi:hypothetical protein
MGRSYGHRPGRGREIKTLEKYAGSWTGKLNWLRCVQHAFGWRRLTENQRDADVLGLTLLCVKNKMQS